MSKMDKNTSLPGLTIRTFEFKCPCPVHKKPILYTRFHQVTASPLGTHPLNRRSGNDPLWSPPFSPISALWRMNAGKAIRGINDENDERGTALFLRTRRPFMFAILCFESGFQYPRYQIALDRFRTVPLSSIISWTPDEFFFWHEAIFRCIITCI